MEGGGVKWVILLSSPWPWFDLPELRACFIPNLMVYMFSLTFKVEL